MSDQPPSDVLGGLPRRRPQRRSDKRAARNTATTAREPAATARNPAATEDKPAAPTATPRDRPERLPQPAQPPGIPRMRRSGRPVDSNGRHLLGTAAQAAAELAEIGLSAGGRALRNAVGRLPRP